jgi:hypothetical protein
MLSERPVGRPPTGEIAQESSSTATRAHIACKLAGRHDTAFLRDIGVAVNTTAVGRAGRARLWHPDPYKPPGPKPAVTATSPPPGDADAADTPTHRPAALRDWLAIDYAALNVSLALVTVRAKQSGGALKAYAALRNIPGVVHTILLVPGKKRTRAMAIVAWDGEADFQRILGRLRELDARWGLQPIELQTVDPAEATWRHLALVAASNEGLRR